MKVMAADQAEPAPSFLVTSFQAYAAVDIRRRNLDHCLLDDALHSSL
jgi:hypothetical protein